MFTVMKNDDFKLQYLIQNHEKSNKTIEWEFEDVFSHVVGNDVSSLPILIHLGCMNYEVGFLQNIH